MVYEGIKTNINTDTVLEETYGVITHGQLNNLKDYGNTLVNLEQIDEAIRKIALAKFGKKLRKVKRPKVSGSKKLREDCVKFLMTEIGRLAGFDICFRMIKSYGCGDVECIIIERK